MNERPVVVNPEALSKKLFKKKSKRINPGKKRIHIHIGDTPKETQKYKA